MSIKIHFRQVNKISLIKTLLTILFIVVMVFFVFISVSSAEFGLSDNITQVKTTDSSSVYYLDHNKKVKKRYINEIAFLSYGNSWDDVKIISQSDLDKWVDVEVVKTLNNPTVYYLSDNSLVPILSGDEFLSLSYKWSDILIINEVELSQYAKSSSQIVDNKQSTALLKIKMNQESSREVVVAADRNLIGEINLRAVNDSIELKEVKIKLSGLYNLDIIESVYLEDGGIEKLAVKSHPSTREMVFYLHDYQLNNNQEKNIGVYVNFASGQPSFNNTIFMSIEGDGIKVKNGEIVGDFPMSSEENKIIDVQNILGSLEVVKKTVGKSVLSGGASGVLASFEISETTGREDVLIDEIVLENKGNANTNSLNNLRLIVDNKLIAGSPTMDNDLISFKPNYLKIKKSDHKTFRILGEISAENGKIIDLQLNTIRSSGQMYALNLKSSINNISEDITVEGSKLSVTTASMDPQFKTFREVDGLLIGSFNINNRNSTVLLEGMSFEIESGTAISHGLRVYLINVKTGELLDTSSVGSNSRFTMDIEHKLSKADRFINIGVVIDKVNEVVGGDYYRVALKNIIYTNSNDEYIDADYNIWSNKYQNKKAVSSVVTVAEPFVNTSTNTISLSWPIVGNINYGFHDSNYIYNFEHNAIDINASQGTITKAAQNGTVITAFDGGVGGYSYVAIDHGNNITTVYGHLSRIDVNVGDVLVVGGAIGLSGGTPGTSGAGQYSTGPHLHFEVIIDGVYVDPELYLN